MRGPRRAASVALVLVCLALSACAEGEREAPDDVGLEQLLARKAQVQQWIGSEGFRSHLKQLRERFSQPGAGRGVLIVAGGRDMFANAAVTLLVLRRALASRLPVEVVHFGPGELPPPELLGLLRSLNGSGGADVFVTDALQAAPPDALGEHHRQLRELKGFPAKVFALAHATRFREVIMLDADSMPLVDPELLLDLPVFRRHGNLFWPDLWHSAWVNETIYSLVGGMRGAPWAGREHHRLVDSGVVLLDRLRHAEALQYLWLLNSHHEWVYRHMHGDKDTFLLAFAMAGALPQFRQVSCFVRDAMAEVPGHTHRFHHLGMVQSLPPGVLAAAAARAVRAGAPSAAALLGGGPGPGRGAPPPPPPPLPAGEGASPLGLAGSGLAGRLGLVRRAGLPVVFHRTSFNSKFFPDCLAADKLASKYCEVQWVSVPLSDRQASHSLKPNMYAFNADEVDPWFYDQHCGGGGGNGTVAATAALAAAATEGQQSQQQEQQQEQQSQQQGQQQQEQQQQEQQEQQQQEQQQGQNQQQQQQQQQQQGEEGGARAAARHLAAAPAGAALQREVLQRALGLPPEWACGDALGGVELPVPVMRVALFGHMQSVLRRSYAAFDEVRGVLNL